MLDQIGNEIELIQRSIEGLIAMEDSLTGEGGQVIYRFYAECHLPFLQFVRQFQDRYTTVLKQMEMALDSLEPDPSGYIRENFLEVEIEHGLQQIARLTESLTDEANSIMNQVADIVALPHLDDSEVQVGIRNATMKRNDTVTQLHEFDATQTAALMPLELDISALRKDIQAGKVKDVVVLSPKQIQKLIERDVVSSDYWKGRAMNWTKRDNEYLIKGEVPSQYIKVTSKEGEF